MRFFLLGISFLLCTLSWAQDLASPGISSDPPDKSTMRFQIEAPQMVSGLIVLSSKQREALVPHENFICFENRFGNCFGIDRLSHTILERVTFESESSEHPHDSNKTILTKLLNAHYNNTEVIIYGFRDSKEFFQTYDHSSNEYDSNTQDFDPLLSAIIRIQNGQSEGHNAQSLKANAFMDKFCGIQTATSIESFRIKFLLDKGVPVKIMLHHGEDLHAATIYGYYETLENRRVFMVHDSNLPQKFQDLYLTPTGWIYPPWSKHIEINVNIMNQKEDNEALIRKQIFKPVKLFQPVKHSCPNLTKV